MARYGMVIDLERCIGCYSCVVSCKQYFGTRPGVDYNQGRFVEWGRFPDAHRRYVSTMCNHCEEPPCMLKCPFGATYKSPEGPVLTDPEKCRGCGVCVRACPYGQRFLTKTDETAFPGAPLPMEELSAGRLRKAEKCTLCQDRLARGEEPICSALCPGGCRIFGDLLDPDSEINAYIRLMGARQVQGTSLFYVLPEGMDPSVLPPAFSNLADGAVSAGEQGGVFSRKEKDDPEYRALMDKLLKARDFVRTNKACAPDIGGEYRYSHCVMCNHGPKCGIKVVVKDGKALRLERREAYGNELLCPMGAASLQDLYAPDRVLYPMRRTNPKGERSRWERISWDEAISEIAAKFSSVKERYGAEKVLFMTGDPKEPRSALQRLAYSFGSPNFGTESSTCYLAAELAMRLIYGVDAKAINPIVLGAAPDINETKVAIIWAHNPATSAAWSYDKLRTVKEYGGAKYIVIDPRVTPTVEAFADIHLPIRAGTDGALALFFANRIIEKDAYDKTFVRDFTNGFEEYRRLTAEYTLSKTAVICGVSEALLDEAANLIADANGPITIKASAAFPQHTNGVNNYRAIMLLIPLTGSLDVEGGHLLANEPLDTDMWGASYAFARGHELLPGLDHLRVDRKYFPVWADTDLDGNIQLNKLPEYVRDGELRAALMLGGNCIMWPQSHEYQEAFAAMDFVVAADFRDNPWTHDYVDMLLPAAMSYERAAPLTFVGRRVFLREPIVEPAGEARSDYRICCDIGVALGLEAIFPGGEAAEEACLRETLATLGGERQVSLEELRAASPDGILIPMKRGPRYRKWEQGLLRKDGKPGFDTPSGKLEFASEILREHGLDPLPTYHEPELSPVSRPDLAERFPFVLSVGARVPFFSNAKERELPWLRRFQPEPIARVNGGDAALLGLSEGETVRVSSPVNEEGIRLRLAISETVRPGSVDLLHGWSQANANELLPRDFDPISGFPPFKEGLCRIDRA